MWIFILYNAKSSYRTNQSVSCFPGQWNSWPPDSMQINRRMRDRSDCLLRCEHRSVDLLALPWASASLYRYTNVWQYTVHHVSWLWTFWRTMTIKKVHFKRVLDNDPLLVACLYYDLSLMCLIYWFLYVLTYLFCRDEWDAWTGFKNMLYKIILGCEGDSHGRTGE